MELTCHCGCQFSAAKNQEICFCPACGAELAPPDAPTQRLDDNDRVPTQRVKRSALLDRLGEFQLLRKIGSGGMGDVYEAIQDTLNRRVAVKVLPTGDTEDDQVLRFRQEAESIAQLKHENIVQIYTYGEADGFYYFSMPFIQGNNLETLLKSRSLTLDQMLDIAMQVARALDKAHQVGVIHRDIKPGNILVEPEGKVWVTDFGLAKWSTGHRGYTKHWAWTE